MTIRLLAASILFGAISSQLPEDVTDKSCRGAVVLVATNEFAIQGVCSSRGSERVLAVSVRNLAPVEQGSLYSVALDFCGSPIIRASAPKGWTTTLDTDLGGVRWSRGGADFGEPGVASGAELAGFEVILKPGWRRSRGTAVLWDMAGTSAFTTHDC